MTVPASGHHPTDSSTELLRSEVGSGSRPRWRRWGARLLGLVLLLAVTGGTWYWVVARLSPDPEDVTIATADVSRFLTLLDSLPLASSAKDSVRLLQERYLSGGTSGLEAFMDSRIGSVELLQQHIGARRDYYAHLATSLADLGSLEAEVRRAFRDLKALYPPARFADVYLVVGRMSTGGTTVPGKLLIGTEMYARDSLAPTGAFSEWERSVVNGRDLIPTIATHESIHMLQRFRWRSTLLEQALREGGADFVAAQVTGRNINTAVHEWAAPREASLWKEFAAERGGRNFASWFSYASADRPADLGYYIGYRIAEAYYQRMTDKRAAIADIIRVRDAEAFLAASGYNGGRGLN